MTDRRTARRPLVPERETIKMPCLNCRKLMTVSATGNEARGIFNVFCRETHCEDRYAWKL